MASSDSYVTQYGHTANSHQCIVVWVGGAIGREKGAVMATPSTRVFMDASANGTRDSGPKTTGAMAPLTDRSTPSRMVAGMSNDPAPLGHFSPAMAGDNRVATFRGASRWHPRTQKRDGMEQWEEDIAESARHALIPINTLAAGPPTKDQLRITYPGNDEPTVTAQYELELASYQSLNTALWDIARNSIDISGPFESADRKHFRAEFMVGDLRDGVGLINWARAFGSTTDVTAQLKLSADLAKYPSLNSDATVADITQHAFELYDLWLLVGNHREDEPSSFYVKLLQTFPVTPPSALVVTLRSYYADLLSQENAVLAKPWDLILRLISHADMLGIAAGGTKKRSVMHDADGVFTAASARDMLKKAIAAVMDKKGQPVPKGDPKPKRDPAISRPNMGKNNCDFCPVDACQAKAWCAGNPKSCCLCARTIDAVDKPETLPKGVTLGPGDKTMIRVCRAYLAQNPTITTLKGLKFSVLRSAEPPKLGTGKQSTPVIGGLSELMGDVTDPDAFMQWVAELDGDVATPLFKLGSGVLSGAHDGDESLRIEAEPSAEHGGTDLSTSNSSVATAASNVSNVSNASSIDDEKTKLQGVIADALVAQQSAFQKTFTDALSQQAQQFDAKLENRMRALNASGPAAQSSDLRTPVQRAAAPTPVTRNTPFAGFSSTTNPETPSHMRPAVPGQAMAALRASRGSSLSPVDASTGGALSSLTEEPDAGSGGVEPNASSGGAVHTPTSQNTKHGTSTAKTDRAMLDIMKGVFAYEKTISGLRDAQRKGSAMKSALAMLGSTVIDLLSKGRDNLSRQQLLIGALAAYALAPHIKPALRWSLMMIGAQLRAKLLASLGRAASFMRDIVARALLALGDLLKRLRIYAVPRSIIATAEPSTGLAIGSMYAPLFTSRVATPLLGKSVTLEESCKPSRRVLSNMNLSRAAAAIVAAAPGSATLMDNGATLHLFKTRIGIVPGTFKSEDDPDVAVGDAQTVLRSHGTNLRALWLYDDNGNREPFVERVSFSPNGLCNILSEGACTHQRGWAFMSDVNARMCLGHNGTAPFVLKMFASPNHLGWLRAEECTDANVIRAALALKDEHVIMTIAPVITFKVEGRSCTATCVSIRNDMSSSATVTAMVQQPDSTLKPHSSHPLLH